MQRLRRLALTAPLALGGLALALIVGGGPDAHGASRCDVAAWGNAYGIYGTGFAFGSPWAATGMITFDGAGGAVGTLTENTGGEIDDATFTGNYSVDPQCRGSLTIRMEHRARAGGGSHAYRHDVHTVDLVGTSGGAKIFWVVVDTYSEGVPSAVPETPDPVVTASGFLERI